MLTATNVLLAPHLPLVRGKKSMFRHGLVVKEAFDITLHCAKAGSSSVQLRYLAENKDAESPAQRIEIHQGGRHVQFYLQDNMCDHRADPLLGVLGYSYSDYCQEFLGIDPVALNQFIQEHR
jgi:hypothetical protein